MSMFAETVADVLAQRCGRCVEFILPGGKVAGRLREVSDHTAVIHSPGGEILIDLETVIGLGVRNNEEEEHDNE